jgi:chemotaxis protein methyltransferase CheR
MNQNYELSGNFDVVFFRNVLIYYSKPTQIQVLQNVCNHLNEGGFLFIGLSENLFGFPLPLERLGSNVYRKKTKPS